MSTSAPSPAGPLTCDSCGAPADDLAPVRRVYVTPAAGDPAVAEAGDEAHPERVDVVDGIERWCFPCRSHYPHQPVEG